jgi:Nif-specific regulatory protein
MPAYLALCNPDGSKTYYELPEDREFAIGRHRSNNLILRGKHVSRQHAVIFFEQNQWHVRDLNSANGTLVNGNRLTTHQGLLEGDRITIGEAELTFHLADPRREPQEGGVAGRTEYRSSEFLQTIASRPQVLDVLCRFMSLTVQADAQASEIIRCALETIHQTIRADVVGFLGLGLEDELLPRIVLPEAARREYRLSRNLTSQVKAQRRSIWLHSERATHEWRHLESLAGFEDALCVPLYIGDNLLGALHAYQMGRSFEEHDLRFCEVIANHLAPALRLKRLLAQLEEENLRLRRQSPPLGEELVGSSLVMQHLREKVKRAAQNLSTVLIVGETGVGKELVATALHRLSPRRNGPFVTMNCGGLTPELVQSALCGHRRGAFTGADSPHKGYLLRADGGVLFLDEVGELPEGGQAHFLRILEGRPFTPLGSDEEVTADVRFVAATNRDLEKSVQEGRFRADLFYRLNRVVISVPPLRDRREDIPELVQHYLSRLTLATGKPLSITPQAVARLQQYDWPGNVRQLFGVLDSAVCFLEGNRIEADHVHLELDKKTAAASNSLPTLNLEELKSLAREQALRVTGGNMTRAAELLGISRSTLLEWQTKKKPPHP